MLENLVLQLSFFQIRTRSAVQYPKTNIPDFCTSSAIKETTKLAYLRQLLQHGCVWEVPPPQELDYGLLVKYPDLMAV
jgi:hypothetical protein